MKRFDTVLRAGVAFGALAATSGTAVAQSTLPPPDVQNAQAAPAAPSGTSEIVITGSRIRRDPLDLDAPRHLRRPRRHRTRPASPRPPTCCSGCRAPAARSTAASTIRGNFGNPPDGGGVGAGAAEVDLRYLGSRRVLVLVDGLRYVNGASASGVPGSVDLNSIPESMIERVEVLQDGASAIYGSDAIAGVVNIITKQRQNGFVASAQIGSYLDQGDGFTPELPAELG